MISLYTLWGLSAPEDLRFHHLDTWLRRESYPWLFLKHQESGWGKGIRLGFVPKELYSLLELSCFLGCKRSTGWFNDNQQTNCANAPFHSECCIS